MLFLSKLNSGAGLSFEVFSNGSTAHLVTSCVECFTNSQKEAVKMMRAVNVPLLDKTWFGRVCEFGRLA